MPVCRIESQWLLLTISAPNGWSEAATNIYFSTALLNEELSKEIYMRKAPGLEAKDFRGRPLIMKHGRSIYGLRQSPKAWNDTMGNDLRTISLLPTVSDTCVYIKGSGDN